MRHEGGKKGVLQSHTPGSRSRETKVTGRVTVYFTHNRSKIDIITYVRIFLSEKSDYQNRSTLVAVSVSECIG